MYVCTKYMLRTSYLQIPSKNWWNIVGIKIICFLHWNIEEKSWIVVFPILY